METYVNFLRSEHYCGLLHICSVKRHLVGITLCGFEAYQTRIGATQIVVKQSNSYDKVFGLAMLSVITHKVPIHTFDEVTGLA
ncbi:hypothetical protein TNIN_186431 [Trichonephila inaurata madagascariensis]|uniref:Uncharacterized protein n=1 Tax=Trichonephila inaurata madagascariensis TaxID=2747483 RepID=A0A8X6WXF9_9ARAC|nr:hypothetical protein TNIN_186431 [Trichonephila inaurata madagascariensis]